MTSPFIKPLVFVAIVGTVGTGGYYGSKLLSSKEEEKSKPKETRKKFSVASLLAKDTVKELLSKEGKQGSDSDWKAAWEKYRVENQSATQDPWGISSWLTIKAQDSQNAPVDFMNKCDSESKREVFDTSDEVYTRVYEWCTKAKTTTTRVGS